MMRMEKPDNPPAAVDSGRDGRHALVVEDNPSNQAIVAAIMQSLDFSISFAEDGEKAVDAVRRERFDIILMDIHMPVMDGFEATRKIRDLGGWCASVPIIAVTANEMANDRATYVAAGLDDLIPKPIDTRQFAEVILDHMAKSAD